MIFDIEKMLIKSYIGKKEFLYPLIIIKTDNYILDVFLDDDKLEINEKIDRTDKILMKENCTINLPEDYAGKTLKLIVDVGDKL